MPRQPTPAHLERNDAGIWEIRWTTGGRSCRLSTRTADAAKAQAALAHFLIHGRRSFDAGLTCEEVWGLYWAEHVQVKVRSWQRLADAWKALQPHFGRLKLKDVDPRVVNRYVSARRALGRSDGTIRRELSALKTALDFMVRTRRLNNTDLPYIELPASPPPRERWLTLDESERLVRVAAARRGGERLSRVERFVAIALHTGARRASIERLTWDRVDFERGMIDFRMSRVQTKKRQAQVPIPARLLPLLQRAKAEATTVYVLDEPGSIRKAFAALVRACALPKVTPHTLRHTFATQAVMAGVSLVDVARILGNSVPMVERVYAKFAPEYLRAAVDFEPVRTPPKTPHLQVVSANTGTSCPAKMSRESTLASQVLDGL